MEEHLIDNLKDLVDIAIKTNSEEERMNCLNRMQEILKLGEKDNGKK